MSRSDDGAGAAGGFGSCYITLRHLLAFFATFGLALIGLVIWGAKLDESVKANTKAIQLIQDARIDARLVGIESLLKAHLDSERSAAFSPRP